MVERIGAGRHGISFSICKSGAVDPVFSDNFDCEYRDWSAIRAALVNDLHLFDHFSPHRMKGFLAPHAPSIGVDRIRLQGFSPQRRGDCVVLMHGAQVPNPTATDLTEMDR